MVDHEKKKLRKELKLLLKNLPAQQRELSSATLGKYLFEILENLDPDRNAVIGAFAPLKDEVNWPGSLKNFSVTSRQFAFPAASTEQDQCFSMNFYVCNFENLELGNEFGVPILSPPIGSQLIVPDILLVPGLGFTKEGSRIGRGKGYYDRYLKEFKGHKVGICFKEQLVEAIPNDKHDELVDILVTDQGIIRCHQFKE